MWRNYNQRYHILTIHFLPSVPEVAPTNVSVFLVEDTSIHIRWDNLSLPPSISAIFQGYKVFIRPAGSADVIVTTVNDLVNFVTIEGLEPLVTYSLTVAGYTQSGVGRESESLSVTTTLGRVISLGFAVRVWAPLLIKLSFPKILNHLFRYVDFL